MLVLVVTGLNFNTLFNSYALDDKVVLTENRIVQEGTKGIPEILGSDYLAGYSGNEHRLSGARYRPLSLVLFALEYQCFGANPFVSHLINLLLFTSFTLLLHRLLRLYIFPNGPPYLAFITCLLFVAHPVHTEVIANVKSRDEIITFLLLVLASLALFRYETERTWSLLAYALCFYMLALLCKETAITWLGVFPLLYYFCLQKTLKASLLSVIPFVGITVLYLVLRGSVVGFDTYPVTDIANSPYLYASVSEAFATKVYMLGMYIMLTVAPFQLCTDYGYNQIPYIQLSSSLFLGTILLLSFLMVWVILGFRGRSFPVFSVLWFFITLSVGTNFLFDLGAPLAERMLFEPSLGVCMLMAWTGSLVARNAPVVSRIALTIVLLLYCFKTVTRNSDWKNNETLFLKDVASSPNSARLNLYACEVFIHKASHEGDEGQRNKYLDKAGYFGRRSAQIHGKFAYVWLRLGIVNYLRHENRKAADEILHALKLEPGDRNTLDWARKMEGEIKGEEAYFISQGNVREAGLCHDKLEELMNTAHHVH
ncbi:MAG: hypothetical protein ACHQRM_12205 [Bacteroidia bacterium]